MGAVRLQPERESVLRGGADRHLAFGASVQVSPEGQAGPEVVFLGCGKVWLGQGEESHGFPGV